jgi:hypothetical protein
VGRPFLQSPLTRSTVIVTIGTLHENKMDPSSPQCLVLATESGEIVVLSPKNFTVVVGKRAVCCLPAQHAVPACWYAPLPSPAALATACAA